MNVKRIIVTLLFLGICVSGCSSVASIESDAPADKVQAEIPRKNIKEVDKETKEEYWILADFENYYECSQVKYAAAFGTVTEIKKSDEPDMVTNGEQSVKLEILGTETSWNERKPNMRFSTSNGFFNQTTDFSNMSRLTFDIYNAQDYEAEIRFYVDSNIGQRSTMQDRLLTNLKYEYNIITVIKLKPNSWNHIELPAEDMRIVKYDANGQPYYVYGAEALQAVGGFHVMFDRGELHEEQEIFYFDNLRAYLSSANE